MTRLCWLLFTVVAIGLQDTIRAQDSVRPIARELVSIAVNPGSDYTKTGRTRFVTVLATYCAEVLKALPTNTPGEDAWVRTEGNTTDLDKSRRLVSSPEFSRRELKTIFDNCAESTATILRVQKLVDRNDSASRSEAEELLRIAFDFNNDNDIRAYASRAGLSPDAWRLDSLATVRKSLLVAALRTLENK